MDESSYRLVARCYGGDRAPEWTFLASLLSHAGLVEPGPGPESYSFREEWLPILERHLATLGGGDAVRLKLIGAWCDEPDPRSLGVVAGWARDLERWDVLEEAWFAIGERVGPLSVETLIVFRDLPDRARAECPILTWASAGAASVLAASPRGAAEVAVGRLLLDSVTLHADWFARESTDAAVNAGSFRMLGERRLPSMRPGESLAAAWRTKEEIDAFIDARSRTGKGPSRRPQAIFRAFSARLALCRADAERAINEARWAVLLSDWEPLRVLAAGVSALAETMLTDEATEYHSDPPVAGIDDDLGVRGLRGLGHAYEILADGLHATRRLDRAGVERALSLVTSDAAASAGLWSLRVALEATHDGHWGDPRSGLQRLSQEITQQSLFGREQDEPFGAALIGRTRQLLLMKVGAFKAANEAIQDLPRQARLLPRAGLELWAGRYQRAIQIAESGIYEEGALVSDSPFLSLVKAAAAQLDGGCDAALRAATIREVRQLLQTGTMMTLAQLPPPARDAILHLCRPQLATEPAFTLLVERLSALNDAGERGVIQLTARERILLPLLATDDPVPEIARTLQVSVNTVRKQVVTLREKFQADTRADLVRKAMRNGAI